MTITIDQSREIAEQAWVEFVESLPSVLREYVQDHDIQMRACHADGFERGVRFVSGLLDERRK